MARISFADQLLKVLRTNPSLSAQGALLEAAEFYKASVLQEMKAREDVAEISKPFYVVLETSTSRNIKVYLHEFGLFCSQNKLDQSKMREVVEGRLFEYKGFRGGTIQMGQGCMNRMYKPPIPQHATDEMVRRNKEAAAERRRIDLLNQKVYKEPAPMTSTTFTPNQ
jgi:hypothetical protein